MFYGGKSIKWDDELLDCNYSQTHPVTYTVITLKQFCGISVDEQSSDFRKCTLRIANTEKQKLAG